MPATTEPVSHLIIFIFIVAEPGFWHHRGMVDAAAIQVWDAGVGQGVSQGVAQGVAQIHAATAAIRDNASGSNGSWPDPQAPLAIG